MSRCPYCLSTRSSLDDAVRICEGCGAEFPLENELRDVREELASARDELRTKEADKSRIVDEDRWMVGCLRLQNRIEALEAEERKLVANLEAE